MTMEMKMMRNTHQEESITSMGTVARPAPRHTPAMAWEKASRKKNRFSMRVWLTAMRTTSGSLLKSFAIGTAKMTISTPMISAMITVARMPKRAPCLVRSYCLAPRFWLTKVVSASAKLVMGRKPKPWSLA